MYPCRWRSQPLLYRSTKSPITSLASSMVSKWCKWMQLLERPYETLHDAVALRLAHVGGTASIWNFRAAKATCCPFSDDHGTSLDFGECDIPGLWRVR